VASQSRVRGLIARACHATLAQIARRAHRIDARTLLIINEYAGVTRGQHLPLRVKT